ncbi:ras-related protein Rac1-like protein [Gymnopilus junonius]|uniref:Ras-related protein Rac1-like protein n=1 Tax=Gymnopilus junonius TaxID=109634 RepID=A0A9P5NIB1_GYMJU|nr:ras-related protein Rac1-like protein [Gymnopilus junonius]
MRMPVLKIVAVGDSGVGKTCLYISYTTRSFPTAYIPTVFDGYVAEHEVNGVTMPVGLWDTIGSDDYGITRIRPLNYIQADVFLLCFSLVDPNSFDNVLKKWAPELQHHAPPDAQIVLVGTKVDLRNEIQASENSIGHSSPRTWIDYQEGLFMRQNINAAAYCECSALTLEGVDNVFQQAMKCAVQPSRTKKKKRSCIVV